MVGDITTVAAITVVGTISTIITINFSFFNYNSPLLTMATTMLTIHGYRSRAPIFFPRWHFLGTTFTTTMSLIIDTLFTYSFTFYLSLFFTHLFQLFFFKHPLLLLLNHLLLFLQLMRFRKVYYQFMIMSMNCFKEFKIFWLTFFLFFYEFKAKRAISFLCLICFIVLVDCITFVKTFKSIEIKIV